MLHNPTVLPARVTVGFWLKPIAPEIMPMIAAQLLAEVHDSAPCASPDAADPRNIGGASQRPWWKVAAGSQRPWWKVAAGSQRHGWLCPARRCVRNEDHVQEGETSWP
jgi:hypothetical protein